MDFDQLLKLSHANEVKIDTHKNYKRGTPHYYNSLRHGFGYYFNTYITVNSIYNYYAQGLSEHKRESFFWHQTLDEDNTQLTIISFQIFFELFIKQLLHKANPKLIHVADKRLSKKNGMAELINSIESGTFKSQTYKGKKLSIPFREALRRLYGLLELSNSGHNGKVVRKFSKVMQSYRFLDSAIHKASLEYLNWYRDRILHNGNSLPSLWLLDYMVTQLYVPIIKEIIEVEREEIGDATFYLRTVTDIDILKELDGIKFKFSDLKTQKKSKDIFYKLLKIGHLKELGRANFNMNMFTRFDQATYETYYRDPKGRGIRFAAAEKVHPDFKEVRKCPCCGEMSLTVYSMAVNNFLTDNKIIYQDWVKCYTCDYHILHNIGDPEIFALSKESLFPSH